MGAGANQGRNDPCACGSGKKYKRCCLQRAEAVELPWRRLRQAEGKLIEEVLAFAVECYGSQLLDAAWADFILVDELDEEMGNPEEWPEFDSAFIPWFVFNWAPDSEVSGGESPDWPTRPLGLEYLDVRGSKLDEFEQRFLREVCRRPYSFYTVTAVERGRSLRLKDVMTHCEYEVLERSGTETVDVGGILYARVLPMDGISIMCGCAPLIIPPRYHTRLIDFRTEVLKSHAPMNEARLPEYDDDLRGGYFDIAQEVYDPRPPDVRNTDGDPLAPTTLHFDLRCTPQEAFERLKSLAPKRTEEELLCDATYGPDGALRTARLEWVREGNASHSLLETTVLASLRIGGSALVVDVNSQRRATEVRAEVEARLGDQVAFKTAVITSLEKELAARRGRPETAADRRRREESERLMAMPEVQEHLKNLMAKHWEDWFDRKIPALRDQTPREAATTPEGRERLEALLEDFRWHGDREVDPLLVPDVTMLRRRLGL